MYVKVRFYRNDGTGQDDTTAGLVLEETKARRMTVSEISRLFPYSEAGKMRRIQFSPPYATWEEAFDHTF